MIVRAARAGDAGPVAAWLAAAAGVAEPEGGYAAALRAQIAGGTSTRVVEEGGEPVAIIVADRAGDTLRFPLVTVRREARGRGIAARALVRIEAEERARRYEGELAAGDGRALYFWLRLGYRPFLGADGRVHMERREGNAP